MGFWQGMKRFLNGKPVFEVPIEGQMSPQANQPIPPQSNESVPDSRRTPVDGRGRKIIPETEIGNIDCNQSGESMTVWATFTNSSAEAVHLDKITLLGQTRELGFNLNGHGSRRIEVYRGQLVSSNAYRSADLDYRLVASGDYFRGRYFVESNYDDGFYYPEDFQLQRPVRDV